MKKPIWQPSELHIAQTNLSAYQDFLWDDYAFEFADYQTLHHWSVTEPGTFWSSIWDFCEVIGDKNDPAFIPGKGMLDARFFPNARLNFAENLLRRHDSEDAIVFWSEDKHKLHRRLCWRQLNELVSRLQQAFQALGLTAGDRVAAYMANTPETVAAMLAATSLGAIWCSCSPDFGGQGLLDRFEQLEPKLLIAHDGHFYAGKCKNNIRNINILTDKIKSIDKVIIVPYDYLCVSANDENELTSDYTLWEDLLAPYQAGDINFPRFPFNHPLYILFSSGTTGLPKCIVHSAGGTLLQHLKEHQLHCDIKPNHRILYYTTTSWMMWHWMVSALASKATLMLYDGSPVYPSETVLFDYIDTEDVTLFGTSAKFIDNLSKNRCRPEETHNLETLRTIASTGSTLSPEHFDYVYEHIKEDVQLSSISGGTDIISCFVLGNPAQPVYRGEITCAGLGMAVDVVDEQGQPVQEQKGELVCSKPFPSMPIGFWNDTAGQKYRTAYFERFPGLWNHGDFAEITAQGGFIIHGRSDTTLNPGGVRIGSAEIYRQVEQIPEVLDSVVIGKQHLNDQQIILFVQLREGAHLNIALIERIKTQIREGATPRHVPDLIYPVDAVPRTRSGKVAELAVKAVVEGREVKNLSALANPEALDGYRNLVPLAHKRAIL